MINTCPNVQIGLEWFGDFLLSTFVQPAKSCLLLASSNENWLPLLSSANVACNTSVRRVRKASALVACQFNSSFAASKERFVPSSWPETRSNWLARRSKASRHAQRRAHGGSWYTSALAASHKRILASKSTSVSSELCCNWAQRTSHSSMARSKLQACSSACCNSSQRPEWRSFKALNARSAALKAAWFTPEAEITVKFRNLLHWCWTFQSSQIAEIWSKLSVCFHYLYSDKSKPWFQILVLQNSAISKSLFNITNHKS